MVKYRVKSPKQVKLAKQESNLGIPLIPLHKIDEVERNRIVDQMSKKNQIAEKDWR